MLMDRMDLQLFAEDTDTDTNTDDNSNSGEDSNTYEDLEREELVNKLSTLEEDFDKKLQSTVDKRVTEAVKTTREKMQEKIEEERRKADMTEEEVREQERIERENEIQEREEKLALKETELEIRDLIEEKELNSSLKKFLHPNKYKKIQDSEERVQAIEKDINELEEVFNQAVESKVDEFKQEYLKGNTPPQLNSNKDLSDSYEKARKDGDAKGMLKARFQ